jgi:hypothetical protein
MISMLPGGGEQFPDTSREAGDVTVLRVFGLDSHTNRDLNSGRTGGQATLNRLKRSLREPIRHQNLGFCDTLTVSRP